MRVLMVSWEYPPHLVGGLGRHVYSLSKILASKGIGVTVLTFSDGTSPLRERSENVDIVRVNPYSLRHPDFVSWIQTLNYLMVQAEKEVGDYDIIHVHDWLGAYAGIVLKHMSRKPMVATIHSTEMGRRGTLSNDNERHIHQTEWWLAFEAWHIICCSKYMHWEISTNLGCPRDKITIIHNGLDKSYISPFVFEKEYPKNEKEKLVLFVGRLVYEKGPQLLIKAAQLLKSDGVKFAIVGDGAMKPYLEDLSRRLGVDGKVRFYGHVSDEELSRLYQQAYLSVFPSLYEPFGIVALEAMGTGVPVIASNTGGLDEIVQDGVNGLKFQNGSAESLAQAIDRLINDVDLRNRIVKSARSSLKRFSWEKAVNATVEVYSRVLEEYNAGKWKPMA